MPLYDYTCSQCGQTAERYAKVNDEELACRHCGGISSRVFSTRYAIHGPPDYVTDNITGEPVRIHSRQQQDRLCREHGVTPKFGKGWV